MVGVDDHIAALLEPPPATLRLALAERAVSEQRLALANRLVEPVDAGVDTMLASDLAEVGTTIAHAPRAMLTPSSTP